MAVSYYSIDGFQNILLWDSFVHSFLFSTTNIEIVLTVALEIGHPMYSAPRSGEYHCYRSAKLLVNQVTDIVEVHIKDGIWTDADEVKDFDCIHDVLLDGTSCRIVGPWGVVHVHALSAPTLEIK